tara:strand:- start:1670 stop:2116 length:447 start_codon:yes stop_codon:yes gene_type:complete
MPHDPTLPGPPAYICMSGPCSEIPATGPVNPELCGDVLTDNQCDCWANGTDYMSFSWDANPGCCYGCMDPDDWHYSDWATCHIQEACKKDCNGMIWSWIEKWNEGFMDESDTPGPFGGQVGCYDEDGLMTVEFGYFAGDLITDPDGGP